MSKWSYIEFVRALTCTFVHGFQNNFAVIVLEEKCYLKSFFLRLVEVQGHRGQIKVKMVIY